MIRCSYRRFITKTILLLIFIEHIIDIEYNSHPFKIYTYTDIIGKYSPGLISSSLRNHTILEAGLEFRATHSIVTSWFSCTSNFESSDLFIISMDEGGAVQTIQCVC